MNKVRLTMNDSLGVRSRPIQTTDAQSRDFLITCPTAAESEAYIKKAFGSGIDTGVIWNAMSGALDSMKPEERDAFFKNIDGYRAKAVTKDAASRATEDGSAALLRERYGTADVVREMNRKARAAWGNPPDVRDIK